MIAALYVACLLIVAAASCYAVYRDRLNTKNGRIIDPYIITMMVFCTFCPVINVLAAFIIVIVFIAWTFTYG